MPLAKDSLSANAKGGSELMKFKLIEELGEEYLNEFQIFVSRVEEQLDPDRIKIYWHQDLPWDPACNHLKDGGWKKFDFFVFNSNWQMQMFNLILGIPYYKSIVLQNAIEPIKNTEKSKEKIKLIYHSTPHRGLALLVNVFDQLSKKYDDIELDVYSSFKIYGWEQRDQEFKDLFDRCKQHPQINYYGSVPNEQVKKALSEAHIFAYPSIWIESSCIALMEAMSARCVCVHPNNGALFDTCGGITRMYQWDEDQQAHSSKFMAILENAINDVRENKVQDEVDYVKFYADNRFNWTRRLGEWKALLSMLKSMKNDNQPFNREEILVYRTS